MDIVGLYTFKYTASDTGMNKKDVYILNDTTMYFKRMAEYDFSAAHMDDEGWRILVSDKYILTTKRMNYDGLDLSSLIGGKATVLDENYTRDNKNILLVYPINPIVGAGDTKIKSIVLRGSNAVVGSTYLEEAVIIKDSEIVSLYYSLTISNVRRNPGSFYNKKISMIKNEEYALPCYSPLNLINNHLKLNITKASSLKNVGKVSIYDSITQRQEVGSNYSHAYIFNCIMTTSDHGEFGIGYSRGDAPLVLSPIYNVWNKNMSSTFRPIRADKVNASSVLKNPELLEYGYSTGKVSMKCTPPYKHIFPIGIRIDIKKGGGLGKAKYSLDTTSRGSVDKLVNVYTPNLTYSNLSDASLAIIRHQQDDSVRIDLDNNIITFVSRFGISITEIDGVDPVLIQTDTIDDFNFREIVGHRYIRKTNTLVIASKSNGIFEVGGIEDYYRTGSNLSIVRISTPEGVLYAFDMDEHKRITVVTSTGVHKSSDMGINYTSVTNNNIAFRINGRDNGYIALRGSIKDTTWVKTDWYSNEAKTMINVYFKEQDNNVPGFIDYIDSNSSTIIADYARGDADEFKAKIEENDKKFVEEGVESKEIGFDPLTSTWVIGGKEKEATISSDTHHFLDYDIEFTCSDHEQYIEGEAFTGALSDGVHMDDLTEYYYIQNAKATNTIGPIRQSGVIPSKEVVYTGLCPRYSTLGVHVVPIRFLLMYNGVPTVCALGSDAPVGSAINFSSPTGNVIKGISLEVNKIYKYSVPSNDKIVPLYSLPTIKVHSTTSHPAVVLGDKAKGTGVYHKKYAGTSPIITDRFNATIDGKTISKINGVHRYEEHNSLNGSTFTMRPIPQGEMILDTEFGVLYFSAEDAGKEYSIDYMYSIDDRYGLTELDSELTLEEILSE